MKLQTFFDKFDLLADAHDGVARMRELVLEWGTAGKLVERSSTDEPAAELVERIENHFAVLRLRKEMRGAPVEALDATMLSSIPPTWQWVRLGNVVDYGSSDKAESVDIPEDAWLLDLEDIEQGTSKLLQRKTFRDSPSKSTKTAFRPGDVLYGKLRPYLNKVLVADAPGYCTTEIIPIRTFGFIDPAYLCYALKRPEFLDYANSKSYGMNLPRLGTEDARLAALPLPPFAEQRRIVAKLDKLMVLCDRLEAQQQERETRHAPLARALLARFADAPTRANLDLLFHKSYSVSPADLRKTILSLAVQGKLVPRDPGDGDARELIDRAMKKREQTIKSKNLRRKQLDESAELSCLDALPSSWCIERLANLVDPQNTISYGVLVPGNDVSDGVPFVRVQDLSLSNHPARPSKTIASEIEKSYARTRLAGGEILLCVVGSIGKLGVVPESWAGANIARAVARIQPISDVDRAYLLIVLQETVVQKFFTSSTRTLAQPTLNVGLIEQTPIPIPPLAEQRRIVAKVDELMTLVDALETQLDAARSAGPDLLEAVISELTHRRAPL
jgi:type I restriction enzyme, S subunit